MIVAALTTWLAERSNKRVSGHDAQLIEELRKELAERDKIIRDIGKDL